MIPLPSPPPAAISAAACRPVPDASRLWADPQVRYVMVGETHGTAESPAAFADLVCTAARERPGLVAALEWSPANQPFLDAFMRSAGSPTDMAAFLKAPEWNQPMKDGRTSRAMLALCERLRILVRSGVVGRVAAFDRPYLKRKGETDDNARNRTMAEALTALARSDGRLVMSYSGSVHASRVPLKFNDLSITPAAARLPQAEVRSVFIVSGAGAEWNCATLSACGVHETLGDGGGARKLTFGAAPSRFGAGAFDAVFDTGLPTTASPPAFPTSG